VTQIVLTLFFYSLGQVPFKLRETPHGPKLLLVSNLGSFSVSMVPCKGAVFTPKTQFCVEKPFWSPPSGWILRLIPGNLGLTKVSLLSLVSNLQIFLNPPSFSIPCNIFLEFLSFVACFFFTRSPPLMTLGLVPRIGLSF